ncbi:MAG: hypothetical protein D6797_04050 [Bdellovibrio sp.]|nr:MAG: hypothetical protein D6797_04050 [Bdellovibrio sp.]
MKALKTLVFSIVLSSLSLPGLAGTGMSNRSCSKSLNKKASDTLQRVQTTLNIKQQRKNKSYKKGRATT